MDLLLMCLAQILEQSLQQRLSSAQSLSLDLSHAPNALELATQTEGYSATDLRDLVARAVHVAAARAAADSLPSETASPFVMQTICSSPNHRSRRC